ncbi:ABC transporter permease subunit [Flavobacterium sp. MFBS3-15]|uniref:ABC transporter permease n=1 Tax=Flavobacterium sp. MFBS3-15 TaxID=2989816 RepID=UPI00223566D2|nr:ABC transporter permease subunit [Flavobacterium sp. MFBS3-15]MCW4468388.1 ABC transporter permease subunit [Flavobacterium sp. MFBS3-15]
MKRLLSIEFQKLWQNRASRILILTYFILLSFIALMASIKFTLFGVEFRLADQGIFNFPYIWHFNTFIASILKFFLAVVIVSMMANEYTYGTLKQNLIDGLSKEEFIKTKFLTVVVFALASTVFIFLLSLLLGYSFSSYDEASIVFSGLDHIGGFFLKLTAFFSFCLFTGILVRRSAFAIGFVFVWWIVEKIIHLLLRWYVLKDAELTEKVIGFFPLESMYNLIKEPISRFEAYRAIETQVSQTAAEVKFYGVHWYEAAIVIFWIAFFMLMSYRILKKRDL